MTRIAALAVAALAACIALAAAPTAHALSPDQRDPRGVVSLLRPGLDQFWGQVVGERFRAPSFAWYVAPATVCGATVTGPNSFFCPGDDTLYLDYNWHRELIRRRGDGASAFVYAHEYGHAMQQQRESFDWAAMNGLYAARELNADCYAGVFMRSAYDRRVVTAADLLEATSWLASNGDDLSWDTEWAHGTGTMRNAWFRYGIAHHSVAGCDLVYRRIHGGRVQPPPAQANPRPKARRRHR